ncbi:MAG: trigger factor [Burkholderiales bacterium]|nr:trigger factor [Burkholderiales bacterium]
MQANIETIGNLERRLNISVPTQDIDTEILTRLKRLAQTVKMHGFRPGKVPLKVVEKQYGTQVRQEVLAEKLQQCFGDAVRENNLRVAGYPRFETKPAGEGDGELGFSATFEVYPEVTVGSVADANIERPVLQVTDAEVDKTIEVLRKQRATFEAVERPAQNEDLVTIDFTGRIDGQPFTGGEGKDVQIVLGSGRMLAEFERAILGMQPDETRQFDLTYPADYHGKEVAGKSARFDLTLKRVEQPKLPALDGDFAKSLGVADGDVEKMRSEVRINVEREVEARIRARMKEQAFTLLLERASLEIPQSLIDLEMRSLAQAAQRDLQGRGIKTKDVPIPADILKAQAQRRVRLGLILAEVVRANSLQAKPEQVLAAVENHAKSFEQPQEVVKWYYSSPERLNEFESSVIEQNVVDWVASAALTEDKPVQFEELMGKSNA